MHKTLKTNDPVRILKAVIARIENDPGSYNQNVLIDKNNTTNSSCGTIACVAGWVTLLKAKNPYQVVDPVKFASKILGFSRNDKTTPIAKLFGSDQVPDAWCFWLREPAKEKDIKKHARAGIKHIKNFVLARWGKKI